MSYTIGFDLGTHQTKICIQDASNAAQKIYEFLEFVQPDGNTTVLFPSIVQINKDETISYGFVDESQCLQLQGVELKQPILNLQDMPPKPAMPAKRKAQYPKKPIEDPWKDSLLKLKGEKTSLDIWKDKCAQIDSDIEQKWNEKSKAILKEYEEECSKVKNKNKQAQKKYNFQLQNWQKSLMAKKTCRFRYFKLHAFTNTGTWTNTHFNSEEITVWYIAYLLILLREKLKNNDMSIQFGTPVSASGKDRDKIITEKAYSLYIAAYNLANEYPSMEDYLAATYKELRNKTKIEKVNESIIDQYIFDDIPEAFAGLIAVARKKKLGNGFHILADIGGGTTDMAMFYIDRESKLPDVISILSFTRGLNYIYEETQKYVKVPLEALQAEFFKNSASPLFYTAVSEYKNTFIAYGSSIQQELLKSFDNSREHHGKRRHELERALKDHQIVYCGGGSIYPSLHSPFGFFTDKRQIDKQLLDIRYLRNKKSIPNYLYTILAISYGLASYEKDYKIGIKCTDVSEVFKKCLPKAKLRDYHNEYGLLDD